MNGNKSNQSQKKNGKTVKVQAGVQKPDAVIPTTGKTHPEDDLQIRSGVVSAIRSSYRFSEDALSYFRRYFSHLLIGEDKSRFSMGGSQGYKDHPHPVGGFVRSHFDNLIMYKYEPSGACLDIGASPVRNVLRYYSTWGVRKPWAWRSHLMMPDLDVRDDIRRLDQEDILRKACHEHNMRCGEKEDRMHFSGGILQFQEPNGITLNVSCKCAIRAVDEPVDPLCGCSVDEFKFYKSVESWYYPGVGSGINTRLIRDYKNENPTLAYVVVNDYYKMILQQLKNTDHPTHKNMIKLLSPRKIEEEHVNFGAVGYGFKTIHGVPESEHLVRDAGDKLEVKATVKGNVLPYKHNFKKTVDADTFAYDYGDYLILVERLEEFVNGDIPSVLLRMRCVERKRFGNLLEELKIIEYKDATFDDLLNDTYADVFSTLVYENHTELKKTQVIEEKKEEKKEMIVPIDLFEPVKYKDKGFGGNEVRLLPDAQKQAHESNIAFLAWIQRQIKDRNVSHHFAARIVDGKCYLVARKFVRSFFGLNVTIDKSLTAMAPVDAVLKAYLNIGVKSNTTSIQQSMIQQQRETKEVTYTMFADQEAFIIARLLRTIEQKRFESIVA